MSRFTRIRDYLQKRDNSQSSQPNTNMDMSQVWNDDLGQRVLDPWPELAETQSYAAQYPNTQNQTTQDSNTNGEREFSSDLDIPAPKVLMSRWAGKDFNMPSPDKRPPKLMEDEDIETARKLELYKLHSVSFELREGDTLVFVDSPPTQRSPSKQSDCSGFAYRPQQFRVHSEKLLATGSSKFSDMFGPTYQFRVARRRSLVNKLPEGIKYVLDMSPPFEGDDLVMQMMELSLTPGIIKWWTSVAPHNVDMLLVSGHDDVCSCMRDEIKGQRKKETEKRLEEQEFNEKETEIKSKTPGLWAKPRAYMSLTNDERYRNFPFTPGEFLEMKKNGENKIYDTPDYRNIPDYCPVRHRNNIIRLLMLIEGKEIILDSASRVWTLVNLSKIWDCTSVLRDRVTQWIMHGSNTRFIEVLPEEALQIGFTLELPEVTQCAFRILVNELALKQAADETARKSLTRTTVFGRRLGDLPDELDNLVQHAARAFVERISAVLEKLNHPELLEFKPTGEWTKLLWLEQMVAHEAVLTKPLDETKALYHVVELKDALFSDMTTLFDKVLWQETDNRPPYFDTMDQDRITYVEPQDFVRTDQVVEHMNAIQRMLLPFVYNEFGVKLDEGLYPENLPSWALRMHRPYQTIITDLMIELQQMFHRNPKLMYDQAWSVMLSANPNAIVNGSIRKVNPYFISSVTLEEEMKDILRPITLSWIRHDIEPQLNITRHLLLTLANSELKYLPLWAGGCNDGTGGVFERYVPPTDMGPNGPGPAYHTGLTIPSGTSSTGSMVDEMRAMRVLGSTTAGSVDVHDSVSTVYRPSRVIADDATMDSESFTVGESEYQDARFQIPAEHQSTGEAIAALVDTADTESEATTTEVDFVTDGDDDDDDMSFWNEESEDDDGIV